MKRHSEVQQNIILKIRGKRGESLSETLVAMLIVALGSILLVSMVIASRNIIQRSQDSYDQYIVNNNAISQRETYTDPQNDKSAAVKTDDATAGFSGQGINLSEKVKSYSVGEGDSELFQYSPAESSSSTSQ